MSNVNQLCHLFCQRLGQCLLFRETETGARPRGCWRGTVCEVNEGKVRQASLARMNLFLRRWLAGLAEGCGRMVRLAILGKKEPNRTHSRAIQLPLLLPTPPCMGNFEACWRPRGKC